MSYPYTPFLLLLATICAPLFAQSDTSASAKANANTTSAMPAFRETRLVGFTRAAAEIQIIAEVSGRCLEVFADVGDKLPGDGNFAKLDDTFIKLELENNANRRQALSSRTTFLQRELERSQTLNQSAALSASELDQVQQEYDQAMLDLQVLKTQARILEERLKRHLVNVHANWRVISRDVEPGQWVAAGMPIGRAADFATLMIPLSLTYAEYETLQRIPSIAVHLSDLNQSVNAQLTNISPGFDPQTRKINAELKLSSGLDNMRGGLRAEITIPSEAEPHTFILDTNAIRERYNTFWLIRPDGSEVEVAVLERRADQRAKVRSKAIKANDVFVIEAGTL